MLEASTQEKKDRGRLPKEEMWEAPFDWRL
jgi:hypothetical protein